MVQKTAEMVQEKQRRENEERIPKQKHKHTLFYFLNF